MHDILMQASTDTFTSACFRNANQYMQVQQMMVAADFDPTDTVWGSLMVACGQAGQLETALTLWQAFKRARGGLRNMKNAEPWCAMLIACAQTYHLQPALTVLSDMRQAGDPLRSCLYDRQSCILRLLHVHSSRFSMGWNLICGRRLRILPCYQFHSLGSVLVTHLHCVVLSMSGLSALCS